MKSKFKMLFQFKPPQITLFVILTALILFINSFEFLRQVELKTLDLRMVSRGTMMPGGETVIVAIDEKSVSELGRWPWPRTTIARLIDQLSQDGAKVIGFDVVFSEAENAPGQQFLEALASRLKKAAFPTLHSCDGSMPNNKPFPRMPSWLTPWGWPKILPWGIFFIFPAGRATRAGSLSIRTLASALRTAGMP